MDASTRKVRGTVLTAVDEEEGYTNESLGDGLAQDHACRHLARIAHLYFARANIHFNLTNTDYSEYIPQLLDKIFGKFVSAESADKAPSALTASTAAPAGAIFEDFGWLHRQSNAPDAPRESNFEALRKRLVSTFDKKKFTRQQLGAFRLCQLMDCFEKGNLFDFIFGEQPRQRMCVYYLPGALLEEQVRRVLFEWFVELNKVGSPGAQGQGRPNSPIPGPAIPISDLFASLSFMQVNTIGVQRPKSLALDLQEFFIFRFFSWFVHITDPPPISNIQPLPQPSLSVAFTASSAPTKPPVLSFKTLNLFKTRVSALLVGEPSLDIFYRYLYYFIPYASGGGEHRADQRAQWLFTNVMIEQWLTRNNVWAGAEGIVASRDVGSLTLAAPAVSGSKKEFLAPTMQLVKAMAIMVTYLQNDPSTKSTTCGHGDAFLSQDLRGSSEALQVLRRPLYHYFLNTISKSSKTCSLKDAGFVHAVNLWLMFLSPWAAQARMTVPKRPGSASAALRSKLAATTANVKAAVKGSPKAEGSADDGPAADGLVAKGLGLGLIGPAKSETVKPVFGVKWLWYIVQHYLIYTDVLRATFLRLQDNSVTKAEFSAMVEAFRSDGVFCDAVVAIIRACEILIEDAMAGTHRDLYATVIASFPWMDNATRPAYTRSDAAVDASRSREKGSSSISVRAAIEEMGEHRPALLEILKRQFAELSWDLSKTPLPSISNLRETVERVLQQMHWQQSQSKKRQQLKGTLAAGEAALSWFNRAIVTTAAGGKTQLSEDELISQTIARLHQVFAIPSMTSAAASNKMSAVDRKRLQQPETEVVFAAPPWLRDGAKCSYRRLTDQGRKQIATGERSATTQSVEYIGDALLNPPPICSYEVAVLVRLFHSLSLWLNRMLKLNPVGEEEELTQDKEVLEEKFRINLRMLADMRNLIFGITVLAFFDLIIFRVGIVRYCVPTILMLAGSLVLEDLALLAFNGTIGALTVIVLVALSHNS